ncbi:vascular endothelial growth factor receptor kdr-like [Folsomia candida]|uniref:Vascular endothelial growth factor receptor 3 n=1 Tax=Folsomia candida TaxID=158441 RepID=A0A226EIZ7_FOLCA|nr:vascular endothelial growth factor receptor kdr-like [Folsomia candida]OXA57693.1 Vascular endothelial growth factor receptor 3 [Folsomia candida]
MGKEKVQYESLPGYKYKAPCLGFFLQGGVKALAIVDVGVEIATMTVLSIGLSGFISDWWSMHGRGEYAKFYFRFVHWTYSYLYNIICIVLSKRLFVAASQREKSALTTWLILSICLYLPLLSLFLVHTFWAKWAHTSGGAAFGVHVAYKLYLFWVVFCFIREIKYYSRINFALRKLSDQDIEEFVYGNPAIPPEDEDDGEKFADKPYKPEFEIPLNRLQIDDSNPLGRGAFGLVLKARLFKEDGDPFCQNQFETVAVKTVDKDADDVYFRALLSELKILVYIGRHENIVNLIGACTSELKERKLYVLVEFCALGSMLNYIRANKGLFVNEISQSRNEWERSCSSYITTSELYSFSTTDLIKWSMETAAGMEFLAGKKVIHGDLAARNILLTIEKTVKLADFGLSHQLYHYSSYVARKEKPMPFRWMSVESLTERKLSSLSDVWSFGVTIWEFFTHGATPFGRWSYSDDFVDLLKSGSLRLEKPIFADSKIYDKLLQCWHLEPRCRPSFSELKIFFSEILKHNHVQTLQPMAFVPPVEYVAIGIFGNEMV